MPWRAPRTLRDGHLDRDTVRASSAMAINQAELSAISQLERQQHGRISMKICKEHWSETGWLTAAARSIVAENNNVPKNANQQVQT